MPVVFRLLKAWWPTASSSTILNLELPVISIIVSIYSYSSLSSYVNALAIFMFANAFVFPITTVVIKEGVGRVTYKYTVNLICTVFLLTNIALVLYSSHLSDGSPILSHVFSISLIAVGVRRYLHGVVIVREATSIIFPASLIRLIVSTSGCYLLITNGLNNAFAPIVALVVGAWIESLVLLNYVHKKYPSKPARQRGVERKAIIQVYFSALFIMVSALMSNPLITYIINTSESMDISVQLEYWAIFFGIVCIAISSIFDIENFLIRYHDEIKSSLHLLRFTIFAFLSAALMSTLYIIVLFYIISPDSIDELRQQVSYIIILSILVSLLWTIRSISRARLIMSNSTRATIVSIAISFVLVVLFNKYVGWSESYIILSSLISYLMIIVFELIWHILFLVSTHLKEKRIDLMKGN